MGSRSTAVGFSVGMRRRRHLDKISDEDGRGARLRLRSPILYADDSEELHEALTTPLNLPEALLSLCSHYDLAPWASGRDDRGVWAFGEVLDEWLHRCKSGDPKGLEPRLETVRLLTNLLVVLGAVIRPLSCQPAGAMQRALEAIRAARAQIGARSGPVPAFPGSARATERLIRVRGWRRLEPGQQTIGEALLDLYLEALATTIHDPCAETLLSASDAWVTVLYLRALPVGFDERLLRATSWYLETYVTSLVHA